MMIHISFRVTPSVSSAFPLGSRETADPALGFSSLGFTGHRTFDLLRHHGTAENHIRSWRFDGVGFVKQTIDASNRLHLLCRHSFSVLKEPMPGSIH